MVVPTDPPNRVLAVLYLASLALLPWSRFPPFPWLHEHAQWSDALFAAAFLLWAALRLRARKLPALHRVHAAMALYLVCAVLSLLLAASGPGQGAWKVLGMADLVALAVVTADLAGRPGMAAAMAWVAAGSFGLAALAAVTGIALFYLGVPTPLLGTYGDLPPSPLYARAQAATIHPNMLASLCIFAWAILARSEDGPSRRIRFLAQGLIGLAIALTISRSLLSFFVALAIRRARKPGERRAAVVLCLATAAVFAGLTALGPAPARREAAATTLETLRAHPWWGTGPGTSPARYRGQVFDAHLTPLSIAATLGLPALAAFLAVPLLLWRARGPQPDPAVWAALAALGLDALHEDIEDFRHLWVLFGLAAAPPDQPPDG